VSRPVPRSPLEGVIKTLQREKLGQREERHPP
jgi:hypothetical protein